MPDENDREIELTRRAALKGYRLMKAPDDHDPQPGHGGYLLVDDDTNVVACGTSSSVYSADLDEVLRYLDEH